MSEKVALPSASCARTASVLIAALLLSAAPALAHEPYTGLRDPVTGADCCNGRDCRPIPDSDVRLARNGYVVRTETTESGEQFIPFERVLWSQDGQFHKCEWGGEIKCFLAPPLGS